MVDLAHNGCMRTLPIALALAASVLAPMPVQATPAPSLTIRVDAGDGVWKRWTLGCSPTRGTHPNRVKACALLAKQGRRLFTPVPKDTMCTMIYGGPQRATITGTWKGAQVKASFNRSNGCEIARWDRAKALFPVKTGVLEQPVN